MFPRPLYLCVVEIIKGVGTSVIRGVAQDGFLAL